MDEKKVTLLDGVMAANAARLQGEEEPEAAWEGESRPFIVTCMDPRLEFRLMPNLGLARQVPLMVRTAGAIIRGEDRSTFRSILAAALLQKTIEVLVIGHTDCKMKTLNTATVRSGLGKLSVPLQVFGAEDPLKWFGHFVSDRSNVQASVDALRRSPLLPAGVPVHGLMYDIETGRLELVVDGYGVAEATASVRIPGAGLAPSQGGWSSGPVSLDGAPAPGGMPGMPPPSLGAPSGGPSFGVGPVTLDAPSPASLIPDGFSPGGGFPAPPPPPPVPQAPDPLPAIEKPPAPPRRREPPVVKDRDDDDAPPPPPPKPRPKQRRRVKRKVKRPATGDSPFDEAQRVLERLRRERE